MENTILASVELFINEYPKKAHSYNNHFLAEFALLWAYDRNIITYTECVDCKMYLYSIGL